VRVVTDAHADKELTMTNDEHDKSDRPENLMASETSPLVATARQRRGFAAMDPKLVTELAKRGGKAAHRAGKAHKFTSDEARLAGRKGGLASHASRNKSVTCAR
jgi:general stress protein YciG